MNSMNQAMGLIRIAVTGGPGAGKTSLLEGLNERGYTVAPEVARAIIADRLKRGLSPRPPQIEFAENIFRRDVEQYVSINTGKGFVFFDRSLVDSLGMVNELGLLAETDKHRVLTQYPFYPTAFILPPWREIYHTDSERDQSYDEAVRVYNALRTWYTECGYDVVEVPRMSIDDRCDFVLQYLAWQGI